MVEQSFNFFFVSVETSENESGDELVIDMNKGEEEEAEEEEKSKTVYKGTAEKLLLGKKREVFEKAKKFCELPKLYDANSETSETTEVESSQGSESQEHLSSNEANKTDVERPQSPKKRRKQTFEAHMIDCKKKEFASQNF